MLYIVAFDLRQPSMPSDYARVAEAIKAYGTWLKLQQNVWIIESAKSHTEIRDELQRSVRANDWVFVGRMNASAWKNLTEEQQQWLLGRRWG